MRVYPINNNINIINNRQEKSAAVVASKDFSDKKSAGEIIGLQNISFHGLFSPSLSDKFNYGMDALDDNTILIVADANKIEDVNLKLNQYAQKIDIPVLNKYTLLTGDKDFNDSAINLNSSFAVFKKNDQYYVLNLGPAWTLTVKKPDDKYNPNYHSVKVGDVKLLQKGEAIETGEIVWEGKHKFMFKPPYNYSAVSAKKYLECRSVIEDKGIISTLNKSVIGNLILNQSKTKNANKKNSVTFADIGGLDSSIEELRKFVIRPAKYPQVFENIRLNKGILLYGPPRCGKTMLGMALANEAGLKYKYMNANEFKKGVVGETENSIRNIFDTLCKEPSILFIDEFDAIAKSRSGGNNARYDDSAVNQLLGCMSDLEKSNVLSFVIAATNRKDMIDSAMTSSGRFGLHLEIPMPDEKGLEAIYNIHSKGKQFDEDVSVAELVQEMKQNNFNGSDVAEMIMLGFFNALERLGMTAKMDAGTFSMNDKKLISISKSDLNSAMKKIVSQK